MLPTFSLKGLRALLALEEFAGLGWVVLKLVLEFWADLDLAVGQRDVVVELLRTGELLLKLNVKLLDSWKIFGLKQIFKDFLTFKGLQLRWFLIVKDQ